MPEVKHYIVTQEREVRVTANDPLSAIAIASVAFQQEGLAKSGVGIEDVYGTTTREVEITDIQARKDYL